MSDAVHIYTANVTDLAGNVGHSSNEAILGSSKADTLVGTSGNDFIIGNGGNDKITGGGGADVLTGGNGKDTFIYNAATNSPPASHDTITDFTHGQDKFDFTNIVGIDTFQGNLNGSGNLTLNAHSVAYIEVSGNTVVLINTTNAAEIVTSSNVSAANMEIDLVGINLHLTNADFLHV
jgi:Ca2+-binding RTX toxin-like protein